VFDASGLRAAHEVLRRPANDRYDFAFISSGVVRIAIHGPMMARQLGDFGSAKWGPNK
jgi:hypothetical protein